jgi:DHA1 family multidrug resistance protein-like MFS transporter
MNGMSNGFNYRSRVFLVLWGVNFLFSFSMNLVPTPRAYLTSAFLGGDQAATIEALGVMMSLGYAASTVGYFVGGFAAESMGKRRVVIVSFLVLAAGCGIFAATPSLYFMYLANLVGFFAAGFSSPAISALVADCSEQCSRGMAYGVFNLSWVSAGIVAPVLAGVVAQFVSLRSPFLIAGFVSVAGTFLAFLMKGKTTEKVRATVRNTRTFRNLFSNGNSALRQVILIFGITNLLNGLLNGFINPVLNGIMLFKFQAAPAEYGLILSLSSSFITGLVQLPGGRLSDKFGRKPLVLFGFLGVPLVLLLGFSGSLLDFGLIMGGISAVGNISGPAISAWLMDLVPGEKRASVSGVTQASSGVGLTGGPSLGSYVWNTTKPDAVSSCAVAALIFAAAMPFYLVLKEPKKDSAVTEGSPPLVG